MTRWHQWAAVAVVAVASAQAQQGGGMRQPQPLAVVVLTNEDLQKEIKVTDDQKKNLKDVIDKATEVSKKRADLFAGGRPDQAKRDELQKESDKLAEDAKAATDKAFTDEQKKRLKQIDVQRMGVGAFTNDDVAKELKATDDQKKTFKTLSDDYQKARGDLQKEYGVGGRPGGGGTPPDADKMAEYTKKAKALTDETMEKAKKELTDDQKKAWKDMVGEAFDVSKLQPQRPRRDN